MSIRFVAWVAAFIAATTCTIAAADDWKVYRYPQDRFSADFPATPAPVDSKPSPDRIIRHFQYMSELGGVAYGVSAALFQHKIIVATPLDAQLNEMITRTADFMQCKIRSQQNLSLSGALGREVVYEKCGKLSGGFSKRRFIIAGDRVYQLMVLGTKPGGENSAETKRFLESFKLTGG
jgi:hypothetical protein